MSDRPPWADHLVEGSQYLADRSSNDNAAVLILVRCPICDEPIPEDPEKWDSEHAFGHREVANHLSGHDADEIGSEDPTDLYEVLGLEPEDRGRDGDVIERLFRETVADDRDMIADGGEFALPEEGSIMEDAQRGRDVVVVNTHAEASAGDWQNNGRPLTVAELNPGCDAGEPVVEVAYFDNVAQSPFDCQDLEEVRKGVERGVFKLYAFPASRLRDSVGGGV